MAENQEEQVKDANLTDEETLLKKYQELKANSVSKEQYDKDVADLKEKNKLYLQAITEGAPIPQDDAPAGKEVSLEDRIAKINKFKGTNLEFWEDMTSTIDLALKKIPESEITKVTGAEGLDELIKVNEGMKAMVKASNGDCDTFRSLYKAKVKDSAPKISADIDKEGGLVNYLVAQQKIKK